MRKLLFALAVVATIAAPSALAQVSIDPAVADGLAFMREEEKLAHDVYALFGLMYADQHPGSNVFSRIAASEQRHTDAVLGLLEAYGLPDPAYADPGVFRDEDLQALYNTLVAVGSEGLTQALGVGVVIEQKDMEDIVEAIEISLGYADIVQVYSNLLAGSENHLEAFLKVLDDGEVESALAGGGKVK